MAWEERLKSIICKFGSTSRFVLVRGAEDEADDPLSNRLFLDDSHQFPLPIGNSSAIARKVELLFYDHLFVFFSLSLCVFVLRFFFTTIRLFLFLGLGFIWWWKRFAASRYLYQSKNQNLVDFFQGRGCSHLLIWLLKWKVILISNPVHCLAQ